MDYAPRELGEEPEEEEEEFKPKGKSYKRSNEGRVILYKYVFTYIFIHPGNLVVFPGYLIYLVLHHFDVILTCLKG